MMSSSNGRIPRRKEFVLVHSVIRWPEDLLEDELNAINELLSGGETESDWSNETFLKYTSMLETYRDCGHTLFLDDILVREHGRITAKIKFDQYNQEDIEFKKLLTLRLYHYGFKDRQKIVKI